MLPPLLIAAAAAWTVPCVLTVQSLWRLRDSDRDRLALLIGALGWGLPCWLIYSFRAPIALADLIPIPYWPFVAIAAYIGFSLWLWGGWAVTRGLLWMMDRARAE